MINNWLVHGDCHGTFSWMTFLFDNYKPEETAIIILGDAGFNFYLNKMDDKLKAEANTYGYRIYCVRGNHEARPRDIINSMEFQYDPEVDGMIWMEEKYPNIRYFQDYQIYTINGYTCGVIGGAYSVDKWYRLAQAGVYTKTDWGYNNPKKTRWFPNEQLTEKEMQECSSLFKEWEFDFIFSHTCPYSWRPVDMFLSSIDQSSVDNSMELWMDKLKDQCKWKYWLFGHYHADRVERPHVEMFFNDTESLDNIADRWNRYDKTGELDWWIRKSPNFGV